MLFNNHHHFFQRSITSSFAKAVDGTFNLSCSINNTSYRICCGEPQIVVAMAG